MKITVVDKTCPISRQEREAVIRRLRLALGRFDDVISRLLVFLEASEDPRGVAAKTCRLVAGTRLGPPLIFTESAGRTLEAVGLATARLARAMSRAAELQRSSPFPDPTVELRASRP